MGLNHAVAYFLTHCSARYFSFPLSYGKFKFPILFRFEVHVANCIIKQAQM
uniref:Uncharacterized protein n=1 Tax=Anguilla anguilla TaxID=7936 RepID=A0A0E9SJN0_ANGAN